MWAQPQTQWTQPQTQWVQAAAPQLQTQWAQPQTQVLQQQQGYAQALQQTAAAAMGQAQQQAQPQQPQQPQAGSVILEVSGCTHATVGNIVRGTFQLHGENHGKPTYKRQGQVNGLDVMTYFWDERDGPSFCGWWFGPKVGGDQVWAYNADKFASTPPPSGWKVPYDGPVDATMTVTAKANSAASGFAQPQSAWSPAGASWQQQQPQQQQQQQLQAQQNQLMQQQRLEQQRQQLEAMQQMQQLNNANRAEEMRQKQVLIAQQAEAQRMLHMQKMEEQRQLMAEKQRQQMEAMRLQQQELQRRRAEEHKRKEEEMAKKKAEQVAVLQIRRVLQRYRAVAPDKVGELEEELTQIIAQQIEACGSQKERMNIEVQQAKAGLKERFEKIAELKKKHEEEREAELARRIEQKKVAAEKIAQLEELIQFAENASKALIEKAEPFSDDKEIKLEDVESCAAAFDEAHTEANAAAQSASEFALKESVAIKNVLPVQGDIAPSCASTLANLVVRLAEVKKSNGNCSAKVHVAKTARIAKAEGQKKHEKIMQSFSKYDLDKDGKLSKKEILAYAKGEFGFVVPTQALDSICRFLIKGSEKGVPKEHFGRLKVMVGVQREIVIDAKRKAAREARDAEIAETKQAWQEKITKCAELVGTLTEKVTAVEKHLQSLAEQAVALCAVDIIAKADDSDKLIEESRNHETLVKEEISKLNGEIMPELKAFLAVEVRKLENQMKALQPRLERSVKMTAKLRSDASTKTQEELEKLRSDVVAIVCHHQAQKRLSREDVFQAFTSKDCIGQADFLKFFKKCEKKEGVEEISNEDLIRLFVHFTSEEEGGSISKDKLFSIISKLMRVAKASVISDDISIKSSKPLRRLEEGEMVEVIMGPVPEDGMEVLRTKVKCLKDELEGWVTPVGNQGTIFLEDGGKVKVVKETILTASFTIGGDDGKAKERKLKVGDICEVREWEKKDPSSGIMRMKVLCKSSGQVGWATSVGNTGIKFLETV